MYWTWRICGPQRVNYVAAAIGSKIYTFGGYCSVRKLPQFTDVYCFDTISLKWSKINYEKTPESPKACCGHSVVAYQHLIYLWGGQSITKASSNILYCFNTKTLSWSIPVTSGQPPKPTDGHSACVIGDYMYIFGGFEDDIKSFSNKTFRINLTTFQWQTVHTTGCPPSKRDSHTASVIDNHMYIFGGRSIEFGVECYPNEVMYLDTNSMKWSVPYKDAQAPCGRRNLTAGVYKGEIYIICGFVGHRLNLRLNETFKYNPVSQAWTEMKVQGKPPRPVRGQCSVVVEDILYFFGGCSPINDADARILLSNGLLNLWQHSDLFLLDFFPTLKKLATINILKNNVDTNYLPSPLQQEIKWIKSQSRCTYK